MASTLFFRVGDFVDRSWLEVTATRSASWCQQMPLGSLRGFDVYQSQIRFQSEFLNGSSMESVCSACARVMPMRSENLMLKIIPVC